MSNLLLMSVPRSGSTWFATRIGQIYGLNVLHEPFRRMVGNKVGTPLHHSEVRSAEDFHDPSFWNSVEPTKREQVLSFYQWLRDQDGILVKETNFLFQIPFFKEALPSYTIVFLRRHLFGVLDSHIRIPDVFRTWHYTERINRLRENVPPEFKEIYNRAQGKEIRGNPKWALLLAHLGVQLIQAQRMIDRIIDYEPLVSDGIPPDLFSDLFPVVREEALLLDRYTTVYRIHGTKNPTNPTAWVDRFCEKDFEVAQEIFQNYINLVFPHDHLSYDRVTIQPELEYVDRWGGISNRTVTVDEYVNFLNILLKEGIDDPCLRLGVQDSFNIIGKENSRYYAKTPNAPMILVSAIGALAYCRYYGGSLPSVSIYDTLAKEFSLDYVDKTNTNFGENVGRTTIAGTHPDLEGLYDIFGNVREFCITDDKKILVVGGSYRDEIPDLTLYRRVEYPIVTGDWDIGFRIQRSEKEPITITCLANLIKSTYNPQELYEKLIEI